jgi:hypothetical protein
LRNDVFLDHPGLRILLGVVFAVGLFRLVDMVASGKTRNNFEEYEPPPSEGKDKEAGDQAKLENPKFWFRPSLVRDLVWFHRSAIGLSMAGATAYALSEFETGTMRSFLQWVGWGGLAAGAAFAVGTLLLRHGKRTEYEDKSPLLWAHWAGVVLAGVILIGLAAYSLHDTPDPAVVGSVRTLAVFRRLPFFLLYAEVAVALVALGAQVTWWMGQVRRSRTNPKWTAAANFVAAALLVVCVLLIFLPTPWAGGVATVAALASLGFAVHYERWFVLACISPLALLPIALIPFVDLVREHWIVVASIDAGVIAVIAWILVIDKSWPPNAFRWGGMIVLPLMGAFLLAGTMAGAAFRIVDYLNKDLPSVLPDPKSAHVLPPAYDWLAVAIAGALILTLLAVAVVRLQVGHEVKGCEPPLPAFPPEPPSELPPSTGIELTKTRLDRARKAIRKSISVVRTVRCGDVLFTALVALTALVLLRCLRFSLGAPEGQNFWHGLFDNSFVNGGVILTSATWILAGFPGLMVLAFRRGTKDEATRRKIGIIWDLGTFWPRRFHPFAPPSYAERAVPELQFRINDATANKAGKTVPGKVAVLGHSQGSVLSLAALASRSREELQNVRFVTYGSPLATFFRRFFPTYFNDGLFDRLARKLNDESAPTEPRWRNYHRWTDPIGGPIFSGTYNDPPTCPTTPGSPPSGVAAEDKPLFDPWWWWDVPGQPVPAPLVHSDYLFDPDMQNWVDGLWEPTDPGA